MIALFIGIVSAVLLLLNIIIWTLGSILHGMLSLAVSFLAVAFMLVMAEREKKKLEKARQENNFLIDSSTRRMMLDFPVPFLLFGEDGRILWYNSASSQVFGSSSLAGASISQYFAGEDKISEDKGFGEVMIRFKLYAYNYMSCETDGKKTFLMSLSDITDFKSVSEKYNASKIVSCLISIDNYAEVFSGISGNETGKLAIEIENKLNELEEMCDGSLSRLERDRYILTLDMEHLGKLMVGNFAILSSIKEIKASNDMTVTLSIGAGCADSSVSKSAAAAKSALELALGRGGDQAVVKINDEYKFFGGSTRETEKKTKVRARVMSQALCEIIENAYQVIIMGHKNPDADSFGGAVGIFSLAESLGVRARIVVDEDSCIKREIEKFREFKEYKFAFISGEQAMGIINDKTVVVLLDTHRADRAQYPELLKYTSKLVVIDHHRKSADYIKDTILTYHEPYASSTCEMITEILQYTEGGQNIKKHEAESLFAGITLDTKNFMVKTGVRTFDAASFLRKRGVDTAEVREFFKIDLASYSKRMKIVESATVYRENIAIAISDIPDIQLVSSASDELLNISGIRASFVLCKFPGFVHISARSMGDINVQIICEKLGGGGHMTVAGAQIKDASVDDAKASLKEALNIYFSEAKKG